MKIKRLGQGIAILAGAMSSAHLTSCGSDCEDSLDCEPYAPFTPIDGGSGEGGAGGGDGGSGGSRGGSAGSASGGDPGAGGMAGAGGSPNECDVNHGPADDACVISDDYGVFVSPNGSDTEGDGTMALPYRTLGQAIATATGSSEVPLVFACSTAGEDYQEALTLNSTHSRLRMYGGFSCDDWTYDTATRANLLSPTSIAVRATNLTRLHIENFNIVAADATSPGTSSFGVFVSTSQNVVLRRVNVTAGKGANGAIGGDGTTGADGAEVSGASVADGAMCGTVETEGNGGGWAAASSCGSRGGKGGGGQEAAVKGVDGVIGIPSTNLVDDDPGTGIGGIGASVAGKAGGDGGPGSNGDSGTDGLDAPAIGIFSSNGYATANGNDGTDGFPGQGGGGGGASMGSAECVGASGGAGGMGGCGGTKGFGGGGGGASVAFLTWQSDVWLDACALTAVSGGNGGKGGNAGSGGAGKAGADGGGPNVGKSIGGGGRGGQGGNGGNAGSGSGGTGGPSFALAYKGTEPDHATSTLTPGTGGGKGAGGTLVTTAPDGLDGMNADVYLIP